MWIHRAPATDLHPLRSCSCVQIIACCELKSHFWKLKYLSLCFPSVMMHITRLSVREDDWHHKIRLYLFCRLVWEFYSVPAKRLHLVNGFVYVNVYNNRATIKTGNKQSRHFKWLSKLAVQHNNIPVCITEAPCLEQPGPFVSCILKSLCSRQVFKHFSPGTSTES